MGTVTIDHDYIRRVYGADSSTKIYMPDCTELTGFLRPPCESDWGYLDWNMNHDAIIHREVATNPSRTVDYEEQGIDRLILRLKSQPTRKPRMAVSETDVYGPNIPPIPEEWEDDGFCIIREDVHEAYLDLNGEARDTKKYALVGMVRIALKHKPKPQPPAPLIGPDTRLGACFRSGGLNPGDPPKYYKVISKSHVKQRNYLVIEQMGAVMESEFTQNWGISTLFLADKHMNSLPYLAPVPDHIFWDQVASIVGGVRRKP